MRKKVLNLFLIFFVYVIYAQNKYKEDAIFIQKNCSERSFVKAKKIYEELKTQQLNNSFDTTLKNYYEFLASTKCVKFDEILLQAWINDKIINKNSFKNYFLNNDENYSNFIQGYLLNNSFRFANKDNLDQGIDDVLQAAMLRYISYKSQSDFKKVIGKNIEILKGQELIHFIESVKENFKLKDFEKDLINKSYLVNYPFDLNFLVTQLINLKTDKIIIEDILNNKLNVWDKGNWSEKFWKTIKDSNLKIKNDQSYEVNSTGTKAYNIKDFLKIQKDNNVIGDNPLLLINNNVVSYQENKLTDTLEKLDIKNIEAQAKQKTVNIFGARGVDGVIMVLTN